MTRLAVQSLYPVAETLPRRDETQFMKKYGRRVSWVYLYKNDTSLGVYQISLLLVHRTTMTGTYSSNDPAKIGR